MSTTSSLPLLSRLEWRLSGSRVAAAAIDYGIHRPRRELLAAYAARERARGPSLPERKVYSQNGEDGVIEEIFRRAGTTNRYVAEFGVGDGSECCSRLLFGGGWQGLLIEGAPWAIPRIRDLYAGKPVTVTEAFITSESIVGLFNGAEVPCDPDLLVVDIDGNDYHVLSEILVNGYRPRVIVAEYNGRWVPPVDWVMPYDAAHQWDGSCYEGASLVAMARLASQFGYALVGCESRGVNAFFVRSDIAAKFPEARRSVRSHYAPPMYGRGFGHPVRMRLHDHVCA